MRIWLADFKSHFVVAVRAVGIGFIVVGWASALASEAQQTTDFRAYLEVGAAIVAVVLLQMLGPAPPSASPAGLLRPLERDIVAVARERSGGNAGATAEWAARLRELAIERLEAGANLPRDRRGWLRALLRLAEAYETGDEFEVGQASGS